LPAPHVAQRSALPETVPSQPTVPVAGEVPLTGFWPHPALQLPERRETPARLPPPAPSHGLLPASRRPLGSTGPARLSRRPMADWCLRSLLWSNRTFDHCTFWFGRPGRWLQGRTGRMALGWLGIGLLLGAVGWGLANWFDWTW